MASVNLTQLVEMCRETHLPSSPPPADRVVHICTTNVEIERKVESAKRRERNRAKQALKEQKEYYYSKKINPMEKDLKRIRDERDALKQQVSGLRKEVMVSHAKRCKTVTLDQFKGQENIEFDCWHVQVNDGGQKMALFGRVKRDDQIMGIYRAGEWRDIQNSDFTTLQNLLLEGVTAYVT